MTTIIRTSDRGTFRKCRQLWKYTSKLHRNLEPTTLNWNFEFGTATHNALEEYYKYQHLTQDERIAFAWQAFQKYMHEINKANRYKDQPEAIEEFEELMLLGNQMLRNYHRYAQKYDDFEVVMTEHEFEVPIPGLDAVYQGRIDMLVRDKDGDLWIWDHKTRGNSLSSNYEYLETDTQIGSYIWAMQQVVEEPIIGFVYQQLLKAYPKYPHQNKNGMFSVDKRQHTTVELFKAAIEEHGQHPDMYQDFLKWLADNERVYIHREPAYRSSVQVDRIGQIIYDEASEMMDSGLSIYPNPSEWNCGGCPFRVPCSANLDGGDEEFLLSDTSLYRERGGTN